MPIENCGREQAQKAAEELDMGGGSATRGFIAACIKEIQQDWGYDRSRERAFIQMIDDFEVTGMGKDMTLQYEFSKAGPTVLQGYEIK